MESDVKTTNEETYSVTVTAVKGKVSSDGLMINDEDTQINWMSISQTQKYFAVGTENGFMIIQNDSSMSMK